MSIVGYTLWAGTVAFVPLGGGDALPEGSTARSDRAAWRAAGCQQCHSIVGLGGHLGPDLTNVISRMSPAYVRAMVRAGPPGMPAYTGLDEQSLDRVVRYLQSIDAWATYPPRALDADALGADR